MIKSYERAFDLVEASGVNMFTFCRQHHLPYTTINTARARHAQLRVDTIYKLCEALDISVSEFFAEEGASAHAGQTCYHSGQKHAPEDDKI